MGQPLLHKKKNGTKERNGDKIKGFLPVPGLREHYRRDPWLTMKTGRFSGL